MERKMLSILSIATLVLATSIDAAAYSKSGKAEVRFTGAGNGVTVTCDLSLTTCFSDGKKDTKFVSGGTYRVYDGFPGGRDYVLYSSEHDGEEEQETSSAGVYDAVLVDGSISH